MFFHAGCFETWVSGTETFPYVVRILNRIVTSSGVKVSGDVVLEKKLDERRRAPSKKRS